MPVSETGVVRRHVACMFDISDYQIMMLFCDNSILGSFYQILSFCIQRCAYKYDNRHTSLLS